MVIVKKINNWYWSCIYLVSEFSVKLFKLKNVCYIFKYLTLFNHYTPFWSHIFSTVLPLYNLSGVQSLLSV